MGQSFAGLEHLCFAGGRHRHQHEPHRIPGEEVGDDAAENHKQVARIG
jgi:hypothetical protein